MFIAELIRADDFRVTIGESVVPIIEIRAVSRHAEPVKPRGAEFGFKTLAKIAFGLRVQVNTSDGVHIFVGSLSLISSGFGRRTSRGGGVAAKIGFRAGAGAMPVGMAVAFDTDDVSSQCACAWR